MSLGSFLGARVCPRAHVLDSLLKVAFSGSSKVKYVTPFGVRGLVLKLSGPALGHFLCFFGTPNRGDSDITYSFIGGERHWVPLGAVWCSSETFWVTFRGLCLAALAHWSFPLPCLHLLPSAVAVMV